MDEEEYSDEESIHDSEDIYDEEADEEMLEADEITAEEAGFMEGYEEEESLQCEYCGKSIDPAEAVVRDIDDEEHMFCSDECADNYIKEHKEEK